MITRQPGLTAANRQRTATAADRDVAIACRLLLTGPAAADFPLLFARRDHPEWSWAQIGAHLGISKDAAVSMFRRRAVRAGLR